MTTRAELRAAVRRRLEDTGANPLWDDAALNDLLGEALHHYGGRRPRQATQDVAATAEATSIAVSPAIAGDRVVRVRDQNGLVVPRQEAEEPGASAAGVGQAWRWWNSTLLLTRPVAADGTWTIEHLAARTLPGDDATAVEIVAGDEEIVVLLAAAGALRRRAVEDAKRGLANGRDGGMTKLAERFAGDAERLLAAGARRARGGWLG